MPLTSPDKPASKGRIIILSVLDFPNGMGNTMRIKMMGRALASIGYAVSLLMAYAPGTVSKNLNHQAEGAFEGIEFKYCNGTPDPPKSHLALLYLKTFGFLRVLLEIWRMSRQDRVRFLYLYGVHGTVFYEDLSYCLLAKLSGIRIIVDVNDAFQEAVPLRIETNPQRYLWRRLKYVFVRLKGDFTITQADYILYVSEFLKAHVVAKAKRSTARMLYVPMLIDAEAVAGVNRMAAANQKVIGYAGFFKGYEGLDFLFEALVALLQFTTDFVCYLYGATQSSVDMVNRLRRMIDDMGLQQHVVIKDSVPHAQLFQVLVNCDVLVLPRRASVTSQAGFSQKIGDYLLSGVPTVSTAVGEAVAVLENGKHLIFTPEGDADAFAAAIHDLFCNEEKYKKIGLNGQKFVIENFDFRVVAQQIEALLEG